MSNDLALKEKADPFEGVRNEHLTIAQAAHAMSREIVDADTAQKAVGQLLWIKEKRRMWEIMVRPVIQSAHEAHKKAVALFKEIDQPLKRAETEILKPALDKYDLEQERKRKAEEDRLNKIVREEAERKQKAEEEKEKKNRIVDQSGQVIPPTEPPPPPPIIPTIVVPKEEKPEGISYVDNWSAEVIDFKKLVQAVAEGNVPYDVLMPNKSYINQSAKALKGFLQWPGVIAKKERGVRVTQRR